MFGAVIGDIVGSVYEHADPPIKTKEFELFTKESTFTDDTVLTLAIAEAILFKWDYPFNIRRFAKKYPTCGYDTDFKKWTYTDPPKPYNGFNNDSATRVSSLGYAFNTVEEVLEECRNLQCTMEIPELRFATSGMTARFYIALLLSGYKLFISNTAFSQVYYIFHSSP